jgi:thiamine biosynthesis lipoprotein
MQPFAGLWWVLFLALPLAGAPANSVRLERSLDAMGTTYTIAVYGADRFALDSAMEDAFEEAHRLDQLLSNYRKDSEWSVVNRDARKGPVQVSEELFALLEKCVGYSRASDGAFDITVGPLMKIWGFYKGSGRVPHRAEIRTARLRMGWRHIILDAKARTVRFDASIEMDPGGIGKGYAVDRMAEILRSRGVSSGIVSAGRSSIYGIGAPPNEPRGWRITLPNPREPQKTVGEFYLRDGSMSTSGTSEKFFVAGGTTYSHIMDPRTGYPARGMLTVSVFAPKTIDSEAWTKPVFIQGREWAVRHKPKTFGVFLCEDRTEIACVSLP